MISRNFSKQDANCILGLIDDSLSCASENDFKKLIANLRDLAPHDFAICGLATMDNRCIIRSYEVININYPSEWLNLYMSGKYHLIDPVIKENFNRFRLQYWADTYKKYDSLKDFIFLASNFGLRTGYTHGIGNNNNAKKSLFSFAGKSVEHNSRTEDILNALVPHFHQALMRIVAPSAKNDIFISAREREVLQWIKHGKSSWDVSAILGISERTVNFHLTNTKQKLGAVSRAQVVAIAMERGLLDIE